MGAAGQASRRAGRRWAAHRARFPAAGVHPVSGTCTAREQHRLGNQPGAALREALKLPPRRREAAAARKRHGGPFGYWILLHPRGHRLQPGRAAACPLLPGESSAYHPPERQRARREQPLTGHHPGVPPRPLGQGRRHPSPPWGHLPARTGASFTTAITTTNPLRVARQEGDRCGPPVPGAGPLLPGGGGAGEAGGVFGGRARNTGARSPTRPPRCHSTASRRGGPQPYPHAAIKGGGAALRHLLTARQAGRSSPPTGGGGGSPRAERGRVAAGPTGTKAARRKMAGAA
ncbi:translation initiation factor IF-2-like [Corvus hawaiiensis]|uniref:translation initiation factor IF-2-like n=1 Tax=Corvus hawaiiensis TaxID=134902 RepID=UPI002019A378|nr:translation initiation factor IF-2-like [Corvus hawaiiensis]